MRKEDKQQIVDDLTGLIRSYNGFYITDTSALTVSQINVIRRKAFQKGIKVQVAKNTLIRKAMEAVGTDYAGLYDVLKGSSTLLFSETANLPAKLIKELRKTGDKPVLKGAYVEESFFIGDNQLEQLASLKSKNELIADVVALLQSPARNVVSALQSGGGKLAGIVKTLSERGE
ncbi:LSU ribosomal protein L10P [Anseongella ginsenosidimutans]|uniref:Large ribosomal subunit protein uL10 n=1 Tax=Anseongella ginsenosidimutans TaxID=496056 RepID=A0A4R3KQ73_9SPHI|nr:50S ribosomal protein L10 [Anseongella ginsenosidimutans]QEC52330.1 50S ribosomal protein L10 [Anseongella ginsenosidimutans]TCS86896.1 LSU ribosomal protein L10P [Anseongella ginsenosidimutans]